MKQRFYNSKFCMTQKWQLTTGTTVGTAAILHALYMYMLLNNSHRYSSVPSGSHSQRT